MVFTGVGSLKKINVPINPIMIIPANVQKDVRIMAITFEKFVFLVKIRKNILKTPTAMAIKIIITIKFMLPPKSSVLYVYEKIWLSPTSLTFGNEAS